MNFMKVISIIDEMNQPSEPLTESVVVEKATSKAQQKAAGAALSAKKNSGTAKLKGASKEMAKMSKKELEKIAGTKHKGLPKKKETKENFDADKFNDEFSKMVEAEKNNKSSDSDDDTDSKKKDTKKGLTSKQKKLPAGLQKAIAKKKTEAKRKSSRKKTVKEGKYYGHDDFGYSLRPGHDEGEPVYDPKYDATRKRGTRSNTRSTNKPRGMYFYNVPPGKEVVARTLGLKQTKSGKWYYSGTEVNRFADLEFGKGRYWEPKTTANVKESDLSEISDELAKRTRDKAKSSKLDHLTKAHKKISRTKNIPFISKIGKKMAEPDLAMAARRQRQANLADRKLGGMGDYRYDDQGQYGREGPAKVPAKRKVKESVERKLSFRDMMKLVVESGGQQQIDPIDQELFAWASRVARNKLGEGMKAEVYAGLVYERMGGVFEMYDILSEDSEVQEWFPRQPNRPRGVDGGVPYNRSYGGQQPNRNDWGLDSHMSKGDRDSDDYDKKIKNNVAIEINGKLWKVIQGESEKAPRALGRAEKIAAGIRRNAAAKGRKEPQVDVYLTAMRPTED